MKRWGMGMSAVLLVLWASGSPPSRAAEPQSSADFFPIGLYCVDDVYPRPAGIPSAKITVMDEFPLIARAGFNVIQSYRFEVAPPTWGNTNEMARTFLDRAQHSGLRVLMGFYWNNDWMWQDMTRTLAHIRERVEALKDHPALFGWNLADEPRSDQGYKPKDLDAAYKMIKALDPHHPILLSVPNSKFGPGDPWGYPFMASADIFMTEYGGTPELSEYGWTSWADIVTDTKAMLGVLAPMGKSILPLFYVYNLEKDALAWGEAPPGLGRYPTTEEIRYLAYAPMIGGAQGAYVNCYRYHYRNYDMEFGVDGGDDVSPSANPAQWARITAVSRELQTMSPILLAPTQEPQEAGVTLPEDAPVELMVKQSQGKTYLFTANPSAEPVTLQIWLDPERFFHSTITRLPDRQRIVSEEADFSPAFTEKWEPYEVRLYEIAPGSPLSSVERGLSSPRVFEGDVRNLPLAPSPDPIAPFSADPHDIQIVVSASSYRQGDTITIHIVNHSSQSIPYVSGPGCGILLERKVPGGWQPQGINSSQDSRAPCRQMTIEPNRRVEQREWIAAHLAPSGIYRVVFQYVDGKVLSSEFRIRQVIE